jgi:hypothetical protein
MHYPVLNKNGEIIASALTNLDLHDIARVAKTYGVRKFFVVTPLKEQKELVKKLVSHWTNGTGSRYNPKRREALELIRLKDSLTEIINHLNNTSEGCPKTVVTCARQNKGSISFSKLRNKLKDGKSYILVFGTAWGLSENFIAEADYLLEPVMGGSPYNHLSVRCAAAVIMDRLLGNHSFSDN